MGSQVAVPESIAEGPILWALASRLEAVVLGAGQGHPLAPLSKTRWGLSLTFLLADLVRRFQSLCPVGCYLCGC